MDHLQKILRQNEVLHKILQQVQQLKMPDWYLGAGCIAQTVWNVLSAFTADQHILDYDLVYFDDKDLSYEAENRYIREVRSRLPNIPVDIKNQARVHLWYEKHFGRKIAPYASVEEAIASWHSTATCIGVRYENEVFSVYAPYGLDDLMSMTVRANKVQASREVYEKKAQRWQQNWPNLKVIPW